MTEKTYQTPLGDIHYWTSRAEEEKPWVVMLPGLTADHHLFDKQIEFFESEYNCFVWDTPAHGGSRPFRLEFTMDDLCDYLHGILQNEDVERPVLIGQSLGGYIAQAYMERYPGEAAGFVSIDSCPLDREYYTGIELAMLKHTYWMYMSFPWGLLVRLGANGTAASPYGRELMGRTMASCQKREYCALAAHGYRLLAEAVGTRRDYHIQCPAMLICGERDSAGSAKRYDRAWARRTGLPLKWLKGAGHNSNTDAPEETNRLIEAFIKESVI